MTESLPEPKSRKESYLAKAAGMEVSVPEAPESREEQYLAAIAEGGGGGTTYTAGEGITIADDTISVDTTTIQPKLTAGSNVTIADNTISATDTTYNAFTGTDGTSAGTSGLVPAPATTDAGKFLKADGTWDTTGGGSEITELTSADYNYPTSGTATQVALWLLPAGTYYAKNTVIIATSSSTSLGGGIYSVAKVTSSAVAWYGMYSPTPSETVILYGRTDVSTGSEQSSASKTVATLSNIFPDPSNRSKIVIGNTISEATTNSIAIGGSARCLVQSNGVAIGNSALCKHPYSISLGASSNETTEQGQLQLGLSGPLGYNNSTYRIISGVYDPQTDHDAATKGYVDGLVGNVASALNAINNGTGA